VLVSFMHLQARRSRCASIWTPKRCCLSFARGAPCVLWVPLLAMPMSVPCAEPVDCVRLDCAVGRVLRCGVESMRALRSQPPSCGPFLIPLMFVRRASLTAMSWAPCARACRSTAPTPSSCSSPRSKSDVHRQCVRGWLRRICLKFGHAMFVGKIKIPTRARTLQGVPAATQRNQATNVA
jgi:hypothetical protein